MQENEKKEAIENIKIIKDLLTQAEKEINIPGAGWISIIWGVFCLVGFLGQKLLIPQGYQRGIWWTALSVIGIIATVIVFKKKAQKRYHSTNRFFLKKYFIFWIPLMILAYTLTVFCILLPALSTNYIPVVILLVVSTGYLIVGLLFNNEILFMGTIGYIGTLTVGVFFLDYSDILLSSLFGIGLILTGCITLYKERGLK
jgi:hypothetical protein